MKLDRRLGSCLITNLLIEGDKTMPADKQGGQGTQRSGEPVNQNPNEDNRQTPRQQPDQGQGRQEQQQERTPGGGKGNR